MAELLPSVPGADRPLVYTHLGDLHITEDAPAYYITSDLAAVQYQFDGPWLLLQRATPGVGEAHRPPGAGPRLPLPWKPATPPTGPAATRC